jgi:hypothetical protein
MERDEYADMFRFRLGQRVRWAEYPHEPHVIGQRRWTQREILAPVVEYRLRFKAHKGSLMGWVSEADLEVWEEHAP